MIVQRSRSSSGSEVTMMTEVRASDGNCCDDICTSSPSPPSSSSSSAGVRRHQTHPHSRMAVFVAAAVLTVACTWLTTQAWNRELVSTYPSSSGTLIRKGGGAGNSSSLHGTPGGPLQDLSHEFSSEETVLLALENGPGVGTGRPAESASSSDDDGVVGGADELADAQQQLRYGTNFHFCGQSHVSAKGETNLDDDVDETSPSLSLLYQCSGPSYDHFATELHRLARNVSSSSSLPKQAHGRESPNGSHRGALSSTSWGRWDRPLPDNVTVLALGNSHLRQISKTLACQYAPVLRRVRFLPSLASFGGGGRGGRREDDEQRADDASDSSGTTTAPAPPSSPSSSSSDAFVLEFDNNSRWISITNTVLVYSESWETLLEEYYLGGVAAGDPKPSSAATSTPLRVADVDAVVLGKFTTYGEAAGTNFEQTMLREEQAFYENRHGEEQWPPREPRQPLSDPATNATRKQDGASSGTSRVDFASIPPPDLLDLARVYAGPIISVSMFSKSDVPRTIASYAIYDDELRRRQKGQNRHSVAHNSSERMNTTARSGNGTLEIIESSPTDDHLSSLDTINQNVYRLDARRYIDMLGLECGSDDKNTVGTCHEPPSLLPMASNEAAENEWSVQTSNHSAVRPVQSMDGNASVPMAETSPSSIDHNRPHGRLRHRQLSFGYRDPSDMHRCAGAQGGHADLVAWDIVEGLYYFHQKSLPSSSPMS